MTAAPAQLRPPRHRAFTLVEMMMSLMVFSVLMGALMGMMILTTGDITSQRSRAERELQLDVALAELRQDIEVALDLRFNGSDTITLSVPNRGVHADDAPEQIEYSIVGANPSSLTRSINGATPETIATGVQDFGLTAAVSSFTGSGGAAVPEPVTSPEVLLVANDIESNNGNTVDDKIWTAQTFEPTLPSNTLSWTITRVECFMVLARARAEPHYLQLRYTEPNGTPSEASLGSVTFTTDLWTTGWAWREFAFSGLPDLSNGERIAIVVGTDEKGISGVKLGIMKDTDSLTPGAHQVSSNSGKKDTWTGAADGDDAIFRVYGTYTTLGPPE
ncbi:MAG: prepilin-type N-terminal cleavage/methylation domain-containing protein [Planctomycetota bacterium]|nr:MAG: prepilin-type N-terminal cleavage/methylation domain-containing protein [Planctomycetota bacterium]